MRPLLDYLLGLAPRLGALLLQGALGRPPASEFLEGSLELERLTGALTIEELAASLTQLALEGSTMAREADIAEWWQGADKVVQFTIYDGDGAGAAVLPLTGFELSFSVIQPCGSEVLRKSTGDGVTITAAAGGVLEVFLQDTDSEGLVPQRYRYELKRANPGLETVLAYGECRLRSRGA